MVGMYSIGHEVWHREGRGDYGIEELRSDEAVSRYLTLSSLAAER